MASILRSSRSASTGAFVAAPAGGDANTNSAASQQQRRQGGLGRKIPFGRVDVNTPNNKKGNKSSSSASAKKKADNDVVSSITKSGRSRATRLFSPGGRDGGRKGRRSSSSSEELRKSGTAAEKAYDFVSITTGRLVSEPTIAPYVDSEARDDVDEDSSEWNRLPSAITADYNASNSVSNKSELSERSGPARTSSIFRGKSKDSGRDGSAAAATDNGSSSIPDIQRANPITADFDVDQHYTIHFDSYHEAEEVNEDTGTATDSLRTSNRLEVDESGGYVIPSGTAAQTETVSAPSPSVDSIFRMMDDAVETVLDSMLCLHRANPIIDDVDAGDLKLSESTTDSRTYYQPESMWNKENNDPMEISDGSKLVDDEVEGYFIPCPTAD